MTHDEMIEVIKAHKEGKEIQWKSQEKTEWASAPCPRWDFDSYDYRVKPIPKKLTIYIYEYFAGDNRLVVLDYPTSASHLKPVKTIETEIE